MLTKATRQGGAHFYFWTTVPEERDKKMQDAALLEAGVIGGLITAHYQQVNASVV